MIFIVVKQQVRSKYADNWLDLVAEFTAASRAEPGNICFEWYRSVEDPNLFVLVEAFTDAAAAQASSADTQDGERAAREVVGRGARDRAHGHPGGRVRAHGRGLAPTRSDVAAGPVAAASVRGPDRRSTASTKVVVARWPVVTPSTRPEGQHLSAAPVIMQRATIGGSSSSVTASPLSEGGGDGRQLGGTRRSA